MKQRAFTVKGFHLDLRVQVMKMDALKALARDISEMGLNTLVMEWEATFPFKTNPLIPSAYAYTGKEVAEFLSYCKKLRIDVIPLQQCFGHVEYILQHDRYGHLRENAKDICQLCPQKVDYAVELFTELFSEICKVHTSDYIHLGCDETYLLGSCPACSSKASKYSKSKVFVDYVAAMCKIVRKLGKRPVIWADMLLAHPEAATELPKELIVVDWNYGWESDRFGSNKPLLKAGLEMWGSPALRSHPDDNYLVAFEKHLKNIRDFVSYSRKSGYTGSVLTSWSTSGLYGIEWGTHWEPMAMFPIRRVFPLKGCRLLLKAFTEALQTEKPLDINAFTENYASSRYGLSKQDAVKFRKAIFSDASAFFSDSSALMIGAELNKKDPAAILKEVKKAFDIMKKLTPKTNVSEFKLYLLYFTIRCHYIAFKSIEARVIDKKFKPSAISGVVKELRLLLKEADSIDKQFEKAFDDYLFPAEIREENRYRRRKIASLCERLARVSA
ncbi:MAG: family 20 glycosylhydrolase [Fibrobacteres bacterium]|nr:family 20 glycosylhydrolase [Fibrobacterota bacterium]